MALTERDMTEALALAPHGERSDFDLNPQARGAASGVAPPPRPAAVLCGLVPRAEGLAVVLTRRARHLRHHAGQISFPGGKVEPWDASPAAAALRESEEEIGLRASQVRLIGHYDSYLTVTGFRVTPHVGLVDPAWHPRLDPNEVDLVFEVPLDFLMDPRNCECRHVERDGQRRRYYAMTWREHLIWGATAGMLKGLADRVAQLGRAAVE